MKDHLLNKLPMRFLLSIFLTFNVITTFAQSTLYSKIKVHSHNDYLRNNPLLDAYREGADQIEADVFLVGDSLVVAHSKKEINPNHSLAKLYLKPIAAWFKQY